MGPIDKQRKYKPKRYDYTLDILCRNNLYDNIILDSYDLVEKHSRLTNRFLRKKPFQPIHQRKYVVVKGDSETRMKLKRKLKPRYLCTPQDKELKIKLKKTGEKILLKDSPETLLAKH